MLQTQNNSRNASVDTFCLLAAFVVIVANAEYPELNAEIAAAAKLLSRWALPFVFIIGGYFLAAKSEKEKTLDVRAAVERLAWIFLTWSVIYLLWKIWLEELTAVKVLDLITAPVFLFTGSYPHLWFFSSLLFGYLFIAVSHHYHAKFLLPIISLASLSIALVGGGYSIFKLGFMLGFNVPRFWLSIPFLYLGFLIHQKGRPAWQLAALLAVIGAALQIFEAQFLYERFGLPLDRRQFLIGTIISAYGMACLALSNLKFMQLPLLAKWGRAYALGAYLIHPLINHLISRVMAFIAPQALTSWLWQAALPTIVLFLCITILSAAQRYTPAAYNLLLGIRAPLQPSQS
jgi:surface polysaccharide O-acyltransferase-like enzyme